MLRRLPFPLILMLVTTAAAMYAAVFMLDPAPTGPFPKNDATTFIYVNQNYPIGSDARRLTRDFDEARGMKEVRNLTKYFWSQPAFAHCDAPRALLSPSPAEGGTADVYFIVWCGDFFNKITWIDAGMTSTSDPMEPARQPPGTPQPAAQKAEAVAPVENKGEEKPDLTKPVEGTNIPLGTLPEIPEVKETP